MNVIWVREMYYGLGKSFEYFEDESGSLVIKEVPADLSVYYPDNYHCHSIPKKGGNLNVKAWLSNYRDRSVLLGEKGSLGNFLNIIKPVPKILEVISKCGINLNSRIIDLGCGGGHLITHLNTAGFNNLTGVDPFLPSGIKSTSSLKFIKSAISEVTGTYDLVILNHVLEHIYDQEAILSYIYMLMDDEASLLVRIPLYKSKAWEIYKENWFQFDAPRHLRLQSVGSFTRMLEKVGFKLSTVIFDSVPEQFLRSEVYKQGISSRDFFDKYNGNINNILSKNEIDYLVNLTKEVNSTGEADQATFIITK